MNRVATSLLYFTYPHLLNRMRKALLRIGFSLIALGILVPVSRAQILYQQNFDGAPGSPGPADWSVSFNQPTPGGITNLTYTNPVPASGGGAVVLGQNGGAAINEPCHNYWVINNSHTPNRLSSPPLNAIRASCGNTPNPDAGVNNRSLHITYQGACALGGPAGLGAMMDTPDYGDEYSWYDDAHVGGESWTSATDQYAFMNTGFSTVGHTNIYLTFDYYIGGDQTGDLTDRTVLYSINGGVTWNVLVVDIPYNFSDHFSFGSCVRWKTYSVKLPQACENQPNVRIAFRWRNDSPSAMTSADYSYNSGFNVDNIKAEVNVCPSYPFALNADILTPCKSQTVTISGYSSPTATFDSLVILPGFAPILIPYPVDFQYNWIITGPGSVNYVGGTTSADSSIQVQFGANGTYTVRLVATALNGDCAGSITDTTWVTQIVVGDCPPNVGITASTLTVCSTNPTPVPGSTTVISLNDITQTFPPVVTRTWALVPASPNGTFTPGGVTSNSANPTISFNTPGTYTIRLTVTTAEGTDFEEVTVTVIDCECSSVAGGGGPGAIYGTGALGNVTISANTSLPSGTYNYQNLTVNAGATLSCSDNLGPLVILVQGTLTLNGTIQVNGAAGTGTTGGAANAGGGAGGAGGGNNGAGATGGAPTSGTTTGRGIGGAVQADGTGSGGGGGAFGGNGGRGAITSGAPAGSNAAGGTPYNNATLTAPAIEGGSGGGGGAGHSSGVGAGGGAGGGMLRIGAGTSIIIGASGAIRANGGNGANPVAGFFTGPGGGGGGAGGAIHLFSPSLQNNGAAGCISANGGNGGGAGFGAYGAGGGAGGRILIEANVTGTGTAIANGGTAGAGAGLCGTCSALNGNVGTIQVQGPPTGGGGGTPPPGIYTCPIASPICAGSTITVNFNATATPAQNSQNLGVLMDDDPAFGSPTTLGNIPNFNIPTGSVASGNTTVTIPAGTTPGTYYISVQNLTTPSLNWDSVQIQVIGLPNAIAINGPSPVCAGSLGNVYSLATTPPAGTSVTWNVTGATNFTPNGNSVTVNWNTTVGTGVVTATLTNSCGSTPVTFNVTKIDPEISLALTGNQSVCSGSVVPYTVGAAQPGVSYNWTVTGGTVAPSTGNAVNITWTQLGTQTIKVRATHQCGDLDSLTLTVIVTGPPTTPVITGPTTLCVGAQGTLAVTNQPGSTVTWTQLPGGTTTFNPLPATGTLATISAPSAGTGTIQVSVANACGNQTATINVQTSNTFDFDSVYGPSILCDTVTLPTLYTGPFISGASYSWNIGGQVSSTVTGPLGNGVLIVWDPNAPVRLVQLTITTSCGVASRDKQVTMVNCSNVGIDLLSVSGTVCFQGSINATFDTTGLFLAGNVFTLEASNDGFNSVVIPLASQSSLNFSGVVLPAGITAGSWELRVVSSTPSAISDVMAMTVVAPPTADAITSSMGAFPMIFCDSYSSLPLTMVNATPVASIQWLQSADSTQAFSPVANGSGVGSVSVSGSSTTFYTAVLDNGFCPAVVADTVKVIVVPRPAVNYSVQPQTVCVGAPVQFDILTPAAQYTALAWDFEDDGTVDNNASTSVQHTYPGVGTYLSRLTLSTNLAGCDATDTVSIYVVEPPTVVFGAQAPYCVGQAITFTDSTVGANEWAWSFGDGATANPATTTTTHSYTQAGTYTVTLTVNASSCGATDSRTIVVNAVPDASFSAAPTELILPDQATTTLTYTGGSANITEYAWVLPVNDTVRGANLTSTTWTATEGGIFTLMLRVTNAGGCIDTASLVVRADEKEALFIPNVFTPNGDGTNEALRLRLTGIRELEVAIYDRWGVLIGSQNYPNASQYSELDVWDGKKGGTVVPEGVYVYHITYTTRRGIQQTRTGTITVLR